MLQENDAKEGKKQKTDKCVKRYQFFCVVRCHRWQKSTYRSQDHPLLPGFL
jgi:hypothetical protein